MILENVNRKHRKSNRKQLCKNEINLYKRPFISSEIDFLHAFLNSRCVFKIFNIKFQNKLFFFLELNCVMNPVFQSEFTEKMATTKPKNVRESEQKLLDAIVNGKRSYVINIFINMLFWN